MCVESTSGATARQVHSESLGASRGGFDAWMSGKRADEAFELSEAFDPCSAYTPRKPRQGPSDAASVNPSDGPENGSRPAASPYLQYIERYSSNEPVPAGTVPEALSARVDRYGKATKLGRFLAEWCEQFRHQDLPRAEKQLACGAWLVFRLALEGDDAAKLHAANYCQQHHTCPFCAVRRSSKFLEKYHPALIEFRKSMPAAVFHHVTLTVRDGVDLPETFGRLTASFQRLLFRRKNTLQGKASSIFGQLLGGVGQFEVKRGSNKQLWHPHMHCVLISAGRLDFKRFQEEWRQCTQQDTAQCKVVVCRADWQARKSARDGKVYTDADYHKQLAKDLVEVLKYPVKFDELPAADVWEAAAFLRGRTLVRPFGCVRNLGEPDNLNDVGIDWASVPYCELLFRFFNRRYELTRRRVVRPIREDSREEEQGTSSTGSPSPHREAGGRGQAVGKSGRR